MTDVKTALSAAEKARLAADEAAKVAEAAEIQALARVAEAKIREASRAFYDLNYKMQFPDELRHVGVPLEDAQDRLAIELFGAAPRLEMLCKLDPDRWSLEGEYRVHASGYTTDEDVACAIATWIFDCGFGRAEYKDEWDEDELERFQALYARTEEAVGKDLATRGFQHWENGNHDT